MHKVILDTYHFFFFFFFSFNGWQIFVNIWVQMLIIAHSKESSLILKPLSSRCVQWNELTMVSQYMELCFSSEANRNEYSYNHLNISELIYKLTLQPKIWYFSKLHTANVDPRLKSYSSLKYHPWITREGHENKGNDHQLKKLLVVKKCSSSPEVKCREQ